MEKLYKSLSDIQASLFVLFHKTSAYHWNVTGTDFYQFHKVFNEQYDEIFEEIDRLSEHMRYLDVKPLSSLSRVIEVSKVGEGKSGITGINMVKDLLKCNESCIQLMTTTSDLAEEMGQRGTCNVLDDLIESAGKRVYFLRSFVS
jgi:starvation-inducible DNA-binding protein